MVWNIKLSELLKKILGTKLGSAESAHREGASHNAP